ncbi:hypothetical protein BKA83DRAFT_4479005 [Pisolithus microcarpus]|nr:hypothetical protein BKA83DRAFT_4479005 [Pisolithus microcarpus]
MLGCDAAAFGELVGVKAAAMLMRQPIYTFFPLLKTSGFQTTIVDTGNDHTDKTTIPDDEPFIRKTDATKCRALTEVFGEESFPAGQKPSCRCVPRPQVREHHSSLPGLVTEIVVVDVHRDTCEKEKGELARQPPLWGLECKCFIFWNRYSALFWKVVQIERWLAGGGPIHTEMAVAWAITSLAYRRGPDGYSSPYSFRQTSLRWTIPTTAGTHERGKALTLFLPVYDGKAENYVSSQCPGRSSYGEECAGRFFSSYQK